MLDTKTARQQWRAVFVFQDLPLRRFSLVPSMPIAPCRRAVVHHGRAHHGYVHQKLLVRQLATSAANLLMPKIRPRVGKTRS
jgi:hypothetical protein